MPAESPVEILREQNPDAIPADRPPEAANYRPADLQGIACQFCSKFVMTGFDGEGEEAVATGYCGQWEALVRGDHVSDAFADPGPPLDEQGNEVWDFADERSIAEVHLAGAEQREEGGFVIKHVLRTGEWPVIPTKGGLVKKPLRIVRDGKSNKDEGIIALAELVENFKAGAIPNPQIPLSDDENDHKNLTRVNTGFIRDLWIVDEEDGSKLVAKMEFTEPEVKEKVLRGTYADVSCGIPWQVRSRGQEYGAALEHVAITNRPFIDGLGPFFAASDKKPDEIEIVHFGEHTQEQAEESEIVLSLRQILESAQDAIISQLELSRDYTVSDVIGDKVRITHDISNTTWTAPFTIDGEQIKLSAVTEWAVEDEGEEQPPEESGSPRSTELSELEQARSLRALLFSQQTTIKRAKEETMPSLTREDLDRLDLSDDTRAAFQTLLEENASLRASSREQDADRRIGELESLGLKERPGALKLYRQVMLSDDGGPAVVLSDNGQKESLTALEVLDKFIEGIKGSDGKVVLSDQALASGNDDPPPANAEGETKPVADRVAAAREELYGPKK